MDNLSKKELKKLKKKAKKADIESQKSEAYENAGASALAQAEKLEAKAAKLLEEAAALRAQFLDKVRSR